MTIHSLLAYKRNHPYRASATPSTTTHHHPCYRSYRSWNTCELSSSTTVASVGQIPCRSANPCEGATSTNSCQEPGCFALSLAAGVQDHDSADTRTASADFAPTRYRSECIVIPPPRWRLDSWEGDPGDVDSCGFGSTVVAPDRCSRVPRPGCLRHPNQFRDPLRRIDPSRIFRGRKFLFDARRDHWHTRSQRFCSSKIP